ncbi:MAG: hypothetical protein M3Z05_21010, partial [Gemmatimonadota bacterium]|nr:hypothetical protein [Gemmatimonadota bacterium]
MNEITYETQFYLTGCIQNLSDARRSALCNRVDAEDAGIATRTRTLLNEVRTGGDSALRDMAARFDGVNLADLEVPRA